MKKVNEENALEELPLEAMILQCKEDKYKLAYAAIRWAKEIKQKENLPDPVPLLVPRALREILSKQVLIKDIEKLPMMIKVASPPPHPLSGPPTLTLNVNAKGNSELAKSDA